jgi:hypothetical protein
VSAGLTLVWWKRTWSCAEPDCEVKGFTETHPQIAGTRELLTVRPAWWAVRQMRFEHASVSGLARQLGAAWRTLRRAMRPLLEEMAADDTRFDGVERLGVDEHVWHHVSPLPEAAGGGPKELTGTVDLTSDAEGRPRARLLDLVPGRSGKASGDCLTARGPAFRGLGEGAGDQSPLRTRRTTAGAGQWGHRSNATVAKDRAGARAQVVRRRGNGTWLRVLDLPEFVAPTAGDV